MIEVKKSIPEIIALTEEVYSLQVLIRFNNCWRTVNENVATHSYFVVFTSRLLYDYYKDRMKLDYKKIMDMSIFHDVPEAEISDLPSNIKHNFKGLKEFTEKLEIDAIQKILKSDYYTEIYKEFIEMKTTEALIVKLADYISVLIYSKKEVSLGNKTFEEIKDNVERQIDNLRVEIAKRLEL